MFHLKTCVFICWLILNCLNICAQEYNITGTVKDTIQPIVFANVVFTNGTGALVTGTITDESGNFSLSVKKGNYTLTISFLGYQTWEQEIIVSNNKDLGTIILEPQNNELAEVVITAKKPLIERKIDRLVFNVENSIAAKGGDIVDALKVTPRLRVENNQISMIGKGSMAVMIDGRVQQLSGEELVNFLHSIPSDNIKSIEVITTPPAKYDAEGNSGLVNIILKKASNFNSWNATLGSSASFATYPSFSHRANFNYRKNRFSALATASYRHGDNIFTNDIIYEYPQDEVWLMDINNKWNNQTANLLLNLSYDLSDNISLGGQYSSNFGRRKNFADNTSKSFIDNNIPAKDYSSEGLTTTKPNTTAININYNQKLDTIGKSFSVDLDYFTFKSDKNNTFQSNQRDFIEESSQLILADNISDQDIENYSAKIDFELPYEWASFSFGGKASSSKTKNIVDANFYIDSRQNPPYLAQFDNFEYTENVQALYFSVNKEFNKKWTLKLGLRGENTQTQSNSISTSQVDKNTYFKLFPTFYTSYKMNDDHTLSFNFGRRIHRPYFSILNPARWYINPQSYVVGNPFLQPSFSYVFELNYDFQKILNSGIYYATEDNGFGQVVYHDVENETQIFKQQNYYDLTEMGVWGMLNFNLYKWWTATLSSTVFYSQSDNFIPLYDRVFKGWGANARARNEIYLNEKETLALSVDFEYNFPGRSRESTYTDYSSLDIGAKAELLKKKLTVAINFQDILKDNISTRKSESNRVLQSFTQYRDTRLARISLSYNFGNNKIAVKKRNTGNQEEQDRATN